MKTGVNHRTNVPFRGRLYQTLFNSWSNASSEISGSESTRCVETVYIQEKTVEILKLKEALNFTRRQLDELRNELNKQKKSVANLTSQVKERNGRELWNKLIA